MALTSDWASKIGFQTYLLEAKLLARINSSIDITSQQDQNISQHSHSKISKENVCQHIETVWVPGENMASKWLKRQTLQLRFHQALRFKLTLHGPSVLQHLESICIIPVAIAVYNIYWLSLFLIVCVNTP